MEAGERVFTGNNLRMKTFFLNMKLQDRLIKPFYKLLKAFLCFNSIYRNFKKFLKIILNVILLGEQALIWRLRKSFQL